MLLDFDGLESNQIAIQVKYNDELMDKNVIAKLEIERRSCLAKGMQWKLITELDIPHVQQANIDWILGGKDLHIGESIQMQVYDLWEEIKGHHFFTDMFSRRALLEGAKLANKMEDYENDILDLGFQP